MRSFLLCVAVITAGLSDLATCQSDTYGQEFFFGLPRTLLQTPTVELRVGTPADSAAFMVEMAGMTSISGMASSTEFATVSLNANLQLSTATYDDRLKGVKVSATGTNPISVFVTMKYIGGFLDFSVHPTTQAMGVTSFEYIGISTDYAGATNSGRFSQIILVAADDDTEISITPSQTVSLPEDAQNQASSLVEVSSGNTHNVTLNQMQTLLVINPNQDRDLSGTRIVSNKPLTVLSGHNCGAVPHTVDFCEGLFVQVPPTYTWGQAFLLSPFGGRTSNQFYRLVTAETGTTIAYRCGNSAALGREVTTNSDTVSITNGMYCYLTATKPIFVVQLAGGNGNDNTGDPDMAIVAPTSGHVSSARFLALSAAEFPNSFISVTVTAEHFDPAQIQLDGAQLMCTWNAIRNITNDDIVGYGCTSSVTPGVHNMTHTGKDGVLSVAAYGWNNSPAQAYAYLTRLNLAAAEPTGPGTTIRFVELVPLYDLSGINGVMELPRVQESNSPPISIPNFLIYGDDVVKTVYVSENGVFSFDAPWRFSHPDRFPGRDFVVGHRHVVAPFWSDGDIRREGTVRYLTITENSPAAAVEILNEIAARVRDELDPPNGKFDPTWMIVAQWDKVHPFPHGSDNRDGVSEEYLNRTNTFQGIIVTDNVFSYAFFSYTCGDVQWSGQGFETSVAGYNSFRNYFSNHPANGFADVGRIISCTRVVAANQNRRKRAVGNNGAAGCVMPANPNVQQALMDCCTALDNDRNSFNPAILAAAQMQVPACPPVRAQIAVDGRFDPLPMFANCFLSRMDVDPMLPGRVLRGMFRAECCYTAGGALIRTGPNAGRLVNLNFNDTKFSADCVAAGRPDKYTDRRPISKVGPAARTICASGSGDPHYTSFDGQYYTFRREGEHTIVGINDDQNRPLFAMQGRINRLLIKAMAFGIPGVETYQFVQNNQVQVVRTRPQPQIVVGNVDNTRIRITRNGNNLDVLMKETGIRIMLMWRGGYMDFRICVPSFLCEKAFGHLGNCDGNRGNDVTMDDRHRVVNSMFTYQNFGRRKRQTSPDDDFVCESVNNCGNTSFVGVPFENLTFTDAQREFCDNEETCLYDLVVTGDETIAATTRDATQNITQLIAQLENSPPNITGDAVFNVTVGQLNIYTFSVADNGNFTVRIDGDQPEGSSLVDNGGGMYTFRWTPAVAVRITALSFIAVDNLDASSVFSPLLHVCTCFNGGQCTLEGVTPTRDLVIQMTCICTEAYSGDTCSEDKNGCADVTCFRGVECQDVPAPGVGAVCGSCPSGFTGDGLKCSDLDECMASSPCGQVCENTFGGFECSCNTGFRLQADNTTCADIDECSGVNDCQQGCTNTEGSFVCTCQAGFMLNVDERACDPQVSCGSNQCSQICAMIGGQPQCFCRAGFELAAGSVTTCIDVDECTQFSPCEQNCVNTVGSFMCSCRDGYNMTGMRSCQDIDECREAALNNSVICTQNDTVCQNTPGSYECVCVPGYRMMNGVCQRFVEMPPAVRVAVPQLGQTNTLTFLVQTFNRSELSGERIQAFRDATAKAINRYCRNKQCVVIHQNGTRQNVQDLVVAAEDIAVPTPNIEVNTDGRPVISFYAQISAQTFLSVDDVTMAIQQAEDLFQTAGYIPRDYCGDLSPCQNGATCTNNANGYSCACSTGYSGQNCTVAGPCASSPCQNGATCTSSSNEYTCMCAVGYSGRDCDVAIGERCTNTTCQNGGTCTNSGPGNSALCVCPAGYVGDYCEVVQALSTGAIAGITIGVLVAVLLVVAIVLVVIAVLVFMKMKGKKQHKLTNDYELPEKK